ncbi:LuxR C-terminal-related transcriptional regulator [Pedococcus sp. KACC 23699]|uniref:LuxR C-terminal-related transcriptional regulator n=1 Tax=Pedococcus sp. KACC 23699 TaxID=3149228 RepID=A0AAU7JVN5_9MICO
MYRPPAERTLEGRDTELLLLDDLLAATADSGQVLVLTGEPGVGKSVLLEQLSLLARDRDYRVLKAIGIQAESRLPFAGLHQLLSPLLHDCGKLPGPQNTALLTALGMATGPPPSLFLTGLAALTLLTEQAARQPIVLAVDDVNWLDQPTQTVLAFVARRLGSDPVSLVATVRTGQEHHLADVPASHHDVRPVTDWDAGRILDKVPRRLSDEHRRAVLEAAQGNPLALVELAAAWRSSPHQRVTEAPFEPVAPTTRRLQESFAGRAAALPSVTRDLILVAAVGDSPALAEILGATRHMVGAPIAADAADAAVSAGLVRCDELELGFRHPLVRSTLLASETAGRRQRARLAWAAFLDHEPDRRVRFQASAATGPDEALASALTDVAARSRGVGAVLDAVMALELAANLTPDRHLRQQRMLEAAEEAFGLGRAELVRRMVAKASRNPLSDLDRAKVTWLAELFDDGDPRDAVRVHQMVASARDASTAGEVSLALNLLYGAAVRCWWSGAGADDRQLVAGALAGLGRDRDPQSLVALAVAEPVSAGAAVLRVLRDPPPVLSDDADALRALGQAAWAVGDSPRCVDLLERASLLMRSQGRLGVLVHVLSIQANACVTLGEWVRAEEALAEAIRLARETDQPIWEAGSRNVAAMLAGLKGHPDVDAGFTADIESFARARGLADQLACVGLARAFTFAGQGQHGPACDELLRVFDPTSPYHHERESLHGLMLLAETAVQAGRVGEAREVLARMEELAERTPSPLLHAHLLYVRPVLGPDETAEELFVHALEQDLSRWPWVQGRLHLAYGVWLRRHRRIVDSRQPMREALSLLTELGATHWAARAQNELRASGERLPELAPQPADVLSAQELQIARLAARGLTNKEIAEHLFCSARTVSSHLYHAFPKLGITSRSQLATRLGLMAEDDGELVTTA